MKALLFFMFASVFFYIAAMSYAVTNGREVGESHRVTGRLISTHMLAQKVETEDFEVAGVLVIKGDDGKTYVTATKDRNWIPIPANMCVVAELYQFHGRKIDYYDAVFLKTEVCK